MKEIKLLCPTGFLGYGYVVEAFKKGVESGPDFIAVDASSTDPGPYYLGEGTSLVPRMSIKRDLKFMLTAGINEKIPLIIGGACGPGDNKTMEWMLCILEEIAIEEKLHFNAAIIRAEIDKNYLLSRVDIEKIPGISPALKDLTKEDIKASRAIVGQMGVEPFIKALDEDIDVIITGRAVDNAIFAALPIKRGFDPGLAWHLGKTVECGGMVAKPTGIVNPVMGEIKDDYFTVYPVDDNLQCTIGTVAAHSLYERSTPYFEKLPGGALDLSECKFEQYDRKTVRVRGSKFNKEETYTIKLEGARKVGYRSIAVFGVRDPILIKQIDYIIDKSKKMVREQFKGILTGDDYRLLYHIYGKDGVMGKIEPQKMITSHELGIVIEVVGRTQDIARDIAYYAYGAIQHMEYEGILCTGANTALPFSPPDIDIGAAYEFNIHHILPIDDPTELFPIEIKYFGGGRK